MTAADVIQSLHEKKRPAPNWTSTKGVYADLSAYPDVEYYVKCPKCGQVHGSYKTMREAHAKRLCDLCDIEAVNKLKKQVKEVDHPKNRGKPGKSTSRLFNEAADNLLPAPPEDDFDARDYVMSTPFTGNWIEVAMHELGVDQGGISFEPARRERYDPEDAESHFKYDVEGSDGTEWRIFKSEDEARTFTLNEVRERIQTDPESFNQDWLGNFVNQDRLRQYLGDEARDIEWLLDMDEQEQVDYLIKAGHLNEEDFYNEEGDFVPNEDLLDAGRDAFRDQKEREFDPMEWFRDVYGKDEAMKYAVEAVGIDADAAAQSAIDTDGWVHFANSYDDSSTDLESGAVAIRTN